MLPWKLAEALNLIRGIQPELRPLGYHIGLHGGVLNRGTSKKDLDLLLLPTSGEAKQDLTKALRLLKRSIPNLRRVFDSDKYGDPERGYYDLYQGKTVFGKAVDLFVVKVC